MHLQSWIETGKNGFGRKFLPSFFFWLLLRNRNIDFASYEALARLIKEGGNAVAGEVGKCSQAVEFDKESHAPTW